MKVNVPDISVPRVVIIGGGFAGLEVAKALGNKPVQVILVDEHNYHTFQPLLYQVATAGIEADSIAYPLRKIFKKYNNLHFRMAKAVSVDPDKNVLETSIGDIHFDYLVIASGSQTNYFGMKKLEALSMAMKSVPEALDLRSCILENFEKALVAVDIEERESLMNYVIVGGGPTGVELAGALGELKKHVLPADYPELDIRRMQIHLIEFAPTLLGAMDPHSSKKAISFLKKLGVNVWLNMKVMDYDGTLVRTNGDRSFRTQTLIWTAGVSGAFINGLDKASINKAGRFEVDEYNCVRPYQHIFAIGDVAAMYSEQYPKGHPMVAQVAIQQGRLLAGNIFRLLNEKALFSFKYKDKGSMSTIGKNKAVVETKIFRAQGMFAWFIWMFVHLMSLIGFRNRLVVLINWTWNYFNYDRGIRLIIRPYVRNVLDVFERNIS